MVNQSQGGLPVPTIERLLPKDLLAFIESTHEIELQFPKSRIFFAEVRKVQFLSIEELRLEEFEVNTWEYYHNHGEEGEDPDLTYKFNAVSLLKTTDGYEPSGVLVYIPLLRQYGTVDTDHALAYTFPHCGWGTIEPNLPSYINAMWYPDEVDMALLRPWADPRFS